MLVQGYHPGLEDDGVYLPAIKKDLSPQLYPHDSDFFQVQLQATVFDKLIAGSIRLSGISLPWGILVWQFASIFLILYACWQISRRCFPEAHSQWAAVAMVASLLTIPVSATALCLVDQHLHPRALATAAILGAILAVLDRRPLFAGAFLTAALLLHPIMASFGISYCTFLFCNQPNWLSRKSSKWHSAGAAAFFLPLGWIFDPASDAWRQAARTRSYYFLLNWRWYEWLGVFAPLVLLWGFRWIARRNRSPAMERLACRLMLFGIFQTIVGLIIMLPPSFERLRPLQPMRFLHLVYLLFFLLLGGLVGQYILRKHIYRWLLLFIPLAAAMFYVQRQTLPATEPLELPGLAPRNAWVQAFYWVRENTPRDAYFALDPYYMNLPGEDYHGFRALAERSALADYLKDPPVVTQVPRLAARWQAEVNAQSGWKNFQKADFQKLKREFGVDWVVLASPGVEGMNCPYRNDSVLVCRVD